MIRINTLQDAQIQIAKAKAPIAVVDRQLDKPSCNFFILCIKLSLAEVTILADLKGLTCHSDANAARLDCFEGHLLAS